jgi:hypothetical protein
MHAQTQSSKDGEATISQSYRVSEFIAAAGEGRREQGRRG